MEKRTRVMMPARIEYWPVYAEPDLSRAADGFIRVVVSIDSSHRSVKADKLAIYDHRPQVVQAALEYKAAKERDDFLISYEIALSRAIKQPGLVQAVGVYKEGRINSEYVNIYPTDTQNPQAFFIVQYLFRKHNAEYEIARDYSLWSWQTVAQSRTGRHEECVYASLTDATHRVLIYLQGSANVGKSGKNYLLIAEGLNWIDDEEAKRLLEEMPFIPHYLPAHRAIELGIISPPAGSN